MKQSEQGVGMLEVVVTLLLLSVGMLGFAALQTSSVKSTNESIDRIKALAVMQSTAEKIRTNPSTSAMTAYKQGFSQMRTRAGVANKSQQQPANMCGLNGQTASPCAPVNLAAAEVHLFAKQFLNSNLVANIVACPRNSSNSNTIGNSDCMIIAWDNTMPTIGNNESVDCLLGDGTYHPSASCIFMEVN